MIRSFLIGLDFGTESARGVLIDVVTGSQMGHHVHPYRHGVVTGEFRSMALPPNFVLQVPSDFIEAAEVVLTVLGRDQDIAGIGVDFTASSPMPVLADGRPLAMVYPDHPPFNYPHFGLSGSACLTGTNRDSVVAPPHL
jgi:L-ribulokinase